MTVKITIYISLNLGKMLWSWWIRWLHQCIQTSAMGVQRSNHWFSIYVWLSAIFRLVHRAVECMFGRGTCFLHGSSCRTNGSCLEAGQEAERVPTGRILWRRLNKRRHLKLDMNLLGFVMTITCLNACSNILYIWLIFPIGCDWYHVML